MNALSLSSSFGQLRRLRRNTVCGQINLIVHVPTLWQTVLSKTLDKVEIFSALAWLICIFKKSSKFFVVKVSSCMYKRSNAVISLRSPFVRVNGRDFCLKWHPLLALDQITDVIHFRCSSIIVRLRPSGTPLIWRYFRFWCERGS